MQTPTYVCACPACGAVQAVPIGQAGQAIACPVCCRTFVAPPAPVAPTKPVSQPMPQPAPYATPLPTRSAPPMAIPLSGPRGPSPIAYPAAHAYPAAPFAQPQATGPAAGNADEGPADEPLKGSSTRGLGLEIVVFGLFVVVFALGVIVVVVLASGKRPWKKDAIPADEIPEVVIDLPSRDDAKPRWSDASQVSLRLHAVKVRLKHVAYGPVRTRDDSRRVVVDEGQSYLILYVNVQNQRAEPVRYKSWYAMPHRLAGQYRHVELTDSNGKFYPIKLFKEASGVYGHLPQATLSLRDEVNDAIVFTVPPDVDRAQIDWLHVSLPAAAYGEPGAYHFEIPTAMIDGWHGIARSGSLTP